MRQVLAASKSGLAHLHTRSRLMSLVQHITSTSDSNGSQPWGLEWGTEIRLDTLYYPHHGHPDFYVGKCAASSKSQAGILLLALAPTTLSCPSFGLLQAELCYIFAQATHPWSYRIHLFDGVSKSNKVNLQQRRRPLTTVGCKAVGVPLNNVGTAQSDLIPSSSHRFTPLCFP